MTRKGLLVWMFISMWTACQRLNRHRLKWKQERRNAKSAAVNIVLGKYVEKVSKIYGEHLKSVILYGSYARGDYTSESDIDIMILVDLTDIEVEKYGQQLSWETYDFNEEYDTEIKPIAKSDTHFKKWLGVYPFYTNVQKEGVELYGVVGKRNY